MSKMKLVAKLYQSSVIERIQELGKNFGSRSPYVVELDPTTACDLACPGCISGDLLNQRGAFDNRFSNERLTQIIDELIKAGVKAVILIGGGEPLSHPVVGQIIKSLGENDVQVGITTNGTFIDKHLNVIAEHSNWTRVSMDAATEATFQYLRPARSGVSKFGLVVENMRRLAKVKKGVLGYSFLMRSDADGLSSAAAGKSLGRVLRTNVHEIFEAAKLARDIGCDYFEPKPSYDDDHNLVMHGEEEMAIAREQVNRARELETDSFKILESVNLDAALRREKIGAQRKSYTSCAAAELRTLITPSGVYVCPYFRGRKDMRIGDLRSQSFAEMWSGPERRYVMDHLNPSIHCANLHCIRHDTNLEIAQIRQALDSGEEPGRLDMDRGSEDRFV